MKVNIYYGGRGLIEDPTLYVIGKLTEVLEELRVQVTRYNLYEEKSTISMLPKTLKEVDGVILATSVEWMGIGGFMQQFLDACWLYADKEKLSKLYMLPVVISSTYGERDAELTLIKAWDMLGGIPCNGLSAYVEDHVEFETNSDYAGIIEKKAESFYRVIHQKRKVLPTSNTAIKQNVLRSSSLPLTPQESEQLSVYVSDDTYVKKQKEDIEELTQLFKEMLDNGSDKEGGQEFIKNLKDNFHPIDDFSASYSINISDINKILVVEIQNKRLKCYYGEKSDADVIAKTTHSVMNRLVLGKITFQGAFMSGELTAKGNFKTLRSFDQVFQFNIL
ncbi:SCP2 sterol-binding domain-containing protein [Lachnospiraceae bacterium MD1]|uniref:SCP2 sterol-binding domain-containing protein n=1 Tax=Variimorphobacter saccharofermentans TaxID=2755051 RepID=A0A839K461_9FIRM|nr:SCP2 sterol-binding domain-containing protein [Variimorphobacter saccharofermentans]MBB2184685.1 SCP2 sterol-binding domain-containing protein [Variimorphobacter saccharofermentans]